MTSKKRVETHSEDSFSDDKFSSNYSHEETSSSESEETVYDGKLDSTCKPEYTRSL